ncbi:MAG: hypothetical protein RIT19_2780 [Verrucomicrobiota bacterium]
MKRVRTPIRWVVVAGLALGPGLVAPAWGGDKAQTSGAVRTDEIPGSRLQSEAERVGTMNKLLRNRQFDVFRAGNSLGGAIDVSLPVPNSPIPNLDPKAQQRLMDEYDRKKNWLVEPGSVKPREVEKADEIDEVPSTGDDDIPNFSRERGRSRRTRSESAQRSDFEDSAEEGRSKTRKDSKLADDDSRAESRTARRTPSESARRSESQGSEGTQTKAISEILAPNADHRNWFKAAPSGESAGTFTFNNGSPSRAGSGFEGFNGASASGARAGAGSGQAAAGTPDLLATPTTGFDGDPGRRFDPTVAPGSAFSTSAGSDPGFFPKSGGGTSAGGGAETGFGAFGGAGAGASRGLEGSVRSLFSAPSSDAGSAIRSSPAFNPRPAVLSFPRSGPF